MSTRRNIVKKAARGVDGIVFTGCDQLTTERAARPKTRRRQVIIKGRRVKVIDVHAHCVIPQAAQLLGVGGGIASSPTVRGSEEAVIVVETRLRAMDQQGIDMEALSINPFWYRTERELAGQIVDVQNEKLAELCAAHPDRFVAFASLALQFPDLAVRQLEFAVKKLGLRGAAIGGSVAGEEFANPKFHRVWAKAEELGVLLFIHPAGMPDLANRLKGNGWLGNTIGNPLDTTIALSHLIFEGTLDKFPVLKICAAHGGGYLPSYAARSDHACSVSPVNCDSGIVLKKKPSEYLRQMYYDSLVFTPEALRHLAAEVGPGHIVLGTDYPYRWQDKSVEHVLSTRSLTDAQRVAVLGGTAAKLLGIKK